MARPELEAFMKAHGVTVTAVFVPFSRSRNAGEKWESGKPRRSLNWRVTVAKDGRDILTTDYSAGEGHAPSYSQGRQTVEQAERVAWECEHGFPAISRAMGVFRKPGAAAIMPDACDVLYSLASDSDVLDYDSFEQWAPDLGYDPDSRKAEAIYRECLKLALQLRNGLGESVLAELRKAAEDY